MWYHSQIVIGVITAYLNSPSKSAGNGFLPFWTNEYYWYVLSNLCKNVKVSQNNSKTWNSVMLSFWKCAQIRIQPWRGPRLYFFQGHNYSMISILLLLQGEIGLNSKEESTATNSHTENKTVQMQQILSTTIPIPVASMKKKVPQVFSAPLSSVKDLSTLITCRGEYS